MAFEGSNWDRMKSEGRVGPRAGFVKREEKPGPVHLPRAALWAFLPLTAQHVRLKAKKMVLDCSILLGVEH